MLDSFSPLENTADVSQTALAIGPYATAANISDVSQRGEQGD